jgi:ABC-type polysaccharide/polyol phosphate transport system ATPase subunit
VTASEPHIDVRGAGKSYRIYHRRETTLKEALIRRRRGVYEELRALDEVSFSIPAGQVVGIFGRNGSGKSTLLKLLARILEPDRGSIHVRGRVAALLEIGAGFHPDYTGIENIFLSGAIYGVPRDVLERRVDDIIAFAELERFADNPVKTYSSGMYTRLGFAIAVNVDPDILLIDEVLAVGDRSFQARCMDRMQEFRDSGKTLILVTHDLGVIESFCERAIWLDSGRVRYDSSPQEAVRRYIAEVTKGDAERSVTQLQAAGIAPATHEPANPQTQLRLLSMQFLDEAGEERGVFHNGEPLRVRIHYRATIPLPSPVFEIEIERQSGEVVTSTSTQLADQPLDDIPAGDGWVEWRIDDLLLTPGTYHFSPRLYESTGLYVFDEHHRWYRVRIHAGAYREQKGSVILPGSWNQGAEPQHLDERDAEVSRP